jgi:hypothetical protein
MLPLFAVTLKKQFFGNTLTLNNISFGVKSCNLSFISLTVKLYPRHLNILTNWTTGFDVYSVGLSLIGCLKT